MLNIEQSKLQQQDLEQFVTPQQRAVSPSSSTELVYTASSVPASAATASDQEVRVSRYPARRATQYNWTPPVFSSSSSSSGKGDTVQGSSPLTLKLSPPPSPSSQSLASLPISPPSTPLSGPSTQSPLSSLPPSPGDYDLAVSAVEDFEQCAESDISSSMAGIGGNKYTGEKGVAALEVLEAARDLIEKDRAVKGVMWQLRGSVIS